MSTPRISKLSKEFQEELAEKFHLEYGFDGNFPFEPEIVLERHFGYQIVPTSNLTKGCSIDTCLIACRKLIRIDQRVYDNDPARARMSLAHELAHLVLHRPYIDSVTELLMKAKRTDEYFPIIGTLDGNEASWAEQQAFYTAGAIMAPLTTIRSKIKTFVAENCEQGEPLGHKKQMELERDLSSFFGISQYSISKRIEHAPGLFQLIVAPIK